VAEGLARVYELFTTFVAMSGARAFDGGLGASVLLLLSLVPSDLVIRLRSVSGKANLALGQILCGLQSKQVLPEPNKKGSDDQNRKGERQKPTRQAHLGNWVIPVVRLQAPRPRRLKPDISNAIRLPCHLYRR
jgi:hypothetical protein